MASIEHTMPSFLLSLLPRRSVESRNSLWMVGRVRVGGSTCTRTTYVVRDAVISTAPYMSSFSTTLHSDVFLFFPCVLASDLMLDIICTAGWTPPAVSHSATAAEHPVCPHSLIGRFLFRLWETATYLLLGSINYLLIDAGIGCRLRVSSVRGVDDRTTRVHPCKRQGRRRVQAETADERNVPDRQ